MRCWVEHETRNSISTSNHKLLCLSYKHNTPWLTRKVDLTKFNHNTKFFNLPSEEWSALKSLKKRINIVIKAADKSGAVVVWRADLYTPSDTPFYAKVDKDLTFINQNIVRNTINDLVVKQELPAIAKSLTVTTPRTSCNYFLPKIHKPHNLGRPIVSDCSCPTQLISSYLDKIMAPIVKTLPSHIKDSQHALEILVTLISLAKTNLFSLWILHFFILSFPMTKVSGPSNIFSIDELLRNLALKHYSV